MILTCIQGWEPTDLSGLEKEQIVLCKAWAPKHCAELENSVLIPELELNLSGLTSIMASALMRRLGLVGATCLNDTHNGRAG